MRSISLPKSVLVAALGCLVLSACGTQKAATGPAAPAGGAASARAVPSTSPSDLSGHRDPEMRFIDLVGQTLQACSPDAPGDKGGGDVPVPDGLVLEEEPTRIHGPGETPPPVPGDAEDVPVPLPSDAPEPPSPAPGARKPAPVEVPLTEVEQCFADQHADRVGKAFNTRTTDYDAMRTKLIALDYPASRVHRMPDHGGAPRVRVDLRFMGGHEALEVTGTGSGVIVETFGAPETEDVKLTDVKRKPRLDTTH
ncbi:SPOR domain-containing protein [Streptomyces sp. NPDC093546]|uniref:SPOR domain-containing protein n=1 Tax=Streptomyces sp. NPDC093546 TaxID=3366040 RepID=UPI00381B1F52